MSLIILHVGILVSCERRRISGCRFFQRRETTAERNVLRSQASIFVVNGVTSQLALRLSNLRVNSNELSREESNFQLH